MRSSTDAPRILILRLSSLGDVILCTSAISAIHRRQPEAGLDWVISSKLISILESDSRLNRVIPFDRKSGFWAWHQLCVELFKEGYCEVLDLHGSLRTQYARLYFRIRGLFSSVDAPRWQTISKLRARRAGFFIFKSLWPASFRPAAHGGIASRAAKLAGGDERDRPELLYFLNGPISESTRGAIRSLAENPRGYISVMPGSAWPGKCWPVSHFAASIKELALPVVILGSSSDRECFELEERLRDSGLRVVSAFRGSSLPETAHFIYESRLLLSNDTGLVHLAEALGKLTLVVFGPTHPDLGFGPWRADSRSAGASIWCRPCSKDGSTCFRVGASRYRCMKVLPPPHVVTMARQMLSLRADP